MDKYDQAFIIRQRILDYCNTVQTATSKMCSEAVGISIDHALRTMTKMSVTGELMKHGTNRNTCFSAATDKVFQTPEDMRQQQADRKRDNRHKELEKINERHAKREPWRIVHIVKADDKPIQNQGGQGSTRHQSWARKYGSST